MRRERDLITVRCDRRGALVRRPFVQRLQELHDEEKRPVQSEQRASEVPVRIAFDQIVRGFVINGGLNGVEVRRGRPVRLVDERLENAQLVHHVVLDEAKHPAEFIAESASNESEMPSRGFDGAIT